MKRQMQTIFSVGVMAALSLTGLAVCLKTPRTYSENENRYLKTSAKPTWESVLDGSWQEDITEYMSDQMPLRDAWTALQSKMQQWLGRKEIAGVYLGDDEYYFEICTDNDISHGRFVSNVQAVSSLAAAMPESRLYFMPAPSSALVYADYLPDHAPYYDEAAKMDLAASLLQNSGCTIVDLREAFDACAVQGQQLYYRTDHHWNTRGALQAYQMFGQAAGLAPRAEEQWNLQIVSESFRGTLDSKVLDADGAADAVEVLFDLPDVHVTADGKPIRLLDMEKLGEKDQYQVFLGGNYGQVTIETGADTGRTLLVFKDSYANCMMQFLYPYFDHITMIDPRYYYDNVEMVLNSQAITDVLYLYNADTFLSDTSLADVLGVG